MTVRDNTIRAGGLVCFFKRSGKISAKVDKKSATKVLKTPDRDLEITSNNATAAATKNPKAASSSLPEVINFYHTGKCLYLPQVI